MLECVCLTVFVMFLFHCGCKTLCLQAHVLMTNEIIIILYRARPHTTSITAKITSNITPTDTFCRVFIKPNHPCLCELKGLIIPLKEKKYVTLSFAYIVLSYKFRRISGEVLVWIINGWRQMFVKLSCDCSAYYVLYSTGIQLT